MTSRPYLTRPNPKETGWPKGIRYIVGNEGCERFSYYGMNAILYIYVVTILVDRQMEQTMAEDLATSTVHLFKAGVYALPMIGAIISDRLAGKYQTILWLSLVYCLGHAVLSATEGTLWGLYLGLGLIAVGAGGIKPCVSAHVGDQFGPGNWFRMEKVYQIFYFIINFGSAFATILIPLFEEWWGWSVAFAIPGILMFIATIFFWMGRRVFVHVPAHPGGRLGLLDTLSSTLLFMTVGSLFFTAGQAWWVMALASLTCLVSGLLVFRARQKIVPDDGFLAVTLYAIGARLRRKPAKLPGDNTATNDQANPSLPTKSEDTLASHWLFGAAVRKYGLEVANGPMAVIRITSVFAIVSIFWALFDQHSSSWIRQAELMDRSFNLPIVGQFDVLASQVPSLNPLLVMLLIPPLTFGVFPLLRRLGIDPTPLRKMTAGMFIAGSSFVVVALIQAKLDAGISVHVAYQIFAYILLTTAEVLVSVTGLEFAYTQAPRTMKSTVMGLWLLAISAGNVLVALLARFSGLPLEDFFWLFAGMMVGAACLFGLRAYFYVPQDYSQASEDTTKASAG